MINQNLNSNNNDECCCCCPCTEIVCVTGPVGPTGPTARCNKSSIYIFKW